MTPRTSTAPAWADWPDERVTCQQCRNRSGYMCVALKVSCPPHDIPHRCDRFAKRVEFKRAA